MAATTAPDSGSILAGRRLASLLNEAVMGFLALVAFAVALGPLVFDLSPTMDRVFQAIEWTVVTLFALEFALRLSREADKGRWLSSRDRILDVVTIGGPFLALLPGVSDAASGSLALRLLRVGRAVAFGTRAGGAVGRREHASTQRIAESMPVVVRVADAALFSAETSDWTTCLAWTDDPGPDWFHATKVSPNRLEEAARHARVDLQGLGETFGERAPARLEVLVSS